MSGPSLSPNVVATAAMDWKATRAHSLTHPGIADEIGFLRAVHVAVREAVANGPEAERADAGVEEVLEHDLCVTTERKMMEGQG